MRIDRTKNARNGIVVGLILRVYQTVVPFIMRTVMIHFMGVEYLGLNSLFSSVLHILNLAELGVGSAMVFSMYRPIAQDDSQKICALMKLYRKYYRVIGFVILTAGLLLLPFLSRLITGSVPPDINLYTLYLLNLLATVLTYWLFAYRNCLLQAHQRQDVIGLITLLSSTIQFSLQFWVLCSIRNYYAYVIIQLLGTIFNNVFTAIVTKRIYPEYLPVGTLDDCESRQINKRIRDLFAGKVGTVVVQYADTLVISTFLGLAALAVYQNYYFIMGAVLAIIEMILGSVLAGLGNSFVTESKEKNENDLMKFSFLYFWLVGVCCCCFLGLYQPFMEIWVGQELMLSYAIVISFVLYFFVYTLVRFLNIYKDAAGLWHEDRFRPLLSAFVNLSLNLMTVQRWGLFGVILSTVISIVLISIPWLMHILFSKVFEKALLRFMRQLLMFMVMTAAAGMGVSLICQAIPLDSWLKLISCMLVCVFVPNAVFFVLARRSGQFAPSVRLLDRLAKGKLGLEKKLIS